MSLKLSPMVIFSHPNFRKVYAYVRSMHFNGGGPNVVFIIDNDGTHHALDEESFRSLMLTKPHLRNSAVKIRRQLKLEFPPDLPTPRKRRK
jgi:hypothetical protein